MKNFKKLIKEALTPHYLRESVNEAKTESELKDAWREWNKKHPKDQIDWSEYREEHGEHLDEVTQKEIDDIENSGNIDIAYKKAMKLLNSLKDESVNESNWEKKLSKKAVHVDDDVYKKNKTQLQAAVKAYDKAESEGDIRGMELALAAVDMLKDESVNEDIVDDKAKIYWLQKFTKGEIDTLPDNPRMEYLRHAMRDQLAQDKEQLRRERNDLSKSSSLIGRMGDRSLEEDDLNERGLVQEASYDEVAMREYGAPYDELSEREKEWVRDKIDMDRGVMEEVNEGYLERAIEDEKDPKKLAMLKAKKEFYDNNPKEKRREMSDDEVGDEVRRLLKRNFMDESEARINELFGIGGPSPRDKKNQAARERSSNKTANYHDLLKYYQFGIARIPRHKREKAGIPQAMHDRYGQEVWDILKKYYPDANLSDTPPSNWKDSADELIMALGDKGNFKQTIYNPFYVIYSKLGPTDSHKKQLGIEEVVRGDDFRFIDIKDLHFETDPDRLKDMKIAFGYKMGGITNREKIEDAEYELRRFRKSINYGNGTSVDPFIPDSYDAINSKLVNGPHAKKRPKVNWNDRKYEEWIESVAAHGGVDHAYDMAQNAKQEQGLIDWVKKNRLGFGDVTALERIQYDIEALAESATGGGPVNPINLTIDDEGASDAALDSEVNHMFEEDLAENTETLDRSNVYPAVDKATNKLFFMTKRPEQENGKDVYVAVSKPGRQLSKAEISNTTSLCKIADKEAFGADGLFESFKPLFEQKLNPNSYELILTCGWDNKTNESKEFNFNKMIKEALTPNYLK
tara:strand:+ start:103 stop:2499 length:2397 start_codon:yes stop_codon:yes gene_type:complete